MIYFQPYLFTFSNLIILLYRKLLLFCLCMRIVAEAVYEKGFEYLILILLQLNYNGKAAAEVRE